MINCGNCTGQHETANQVRYCYGTRPPYVAPDNVPEPEMTEAQHNFLINLYSRAGEDQPDDLQEYSRKFASLEITRLKDLPTVNRPSNSQKLVDEMPSVPPGRYAVRSGDGDWRFYMVQKPAEGRWAGRTFVKIQAGSDLHPLRNITMRFAVLRDIAVDPRQASLDYGRQLGHCGVCGRELTNEQSRAAGIGPVCASREGW